MLDSKRSACSRCERHSWSRSATHQLWTSSKQGGFIPTFRPLQAR